MTTLLEDVEALLATTSPAGGVSYAINTAQPPVYPYIVWQRIVSTPNVSLKGPSDLQNTRIQVDVYARRISDADTLQKLIAAAFAGWSVQNVPLSDQDMYEPDVKAFRISSDWSVWATN